MSSARRITDYWFIWHDGMERPMWFLSEGDARAKADELALHFPGQTIYVGDTNPRVTVTLPNALQISKF